MSFGNSVLPVCSSEFSWIFIASVGFVSQALMFWCKQRIQSLLCDGCTSYKELNSYCYAWSWNDILILIKQYCHVFCTTRHSIQLILPDNVRQNHRTVVVVGRQIFDPPYHTSPTKCFYNFIRLFSLCESSVLWHLWTEKSHRSEVSVSLPGSLRLWSVQPEGQMWQWGASQVKMELFTQLT